MSCPPGVMPAMQSDFRFARQVEMAAVRPAGPLPIMTTSYTEEAIGRSNGPAAISVWKGRGAAFWSSPPFALQMPGGYFAQLLDVDLSTGRIGDFRLPESWLRSYLGGKGIAARLLLEGYRGSDPYGLDNPLIYMTGPLVGALVGGSGR